MSIRDDQLDGAAWVLEQALGASPGTTALVVHDEATTATAACFRDAANSRGIRLKALLVPSAVQASYGAKRKPRLEQSIRDEIDKVTRIIVLQEWRDEVTRFRFDVLRYSTKPRGKRVASMPGVTLDTLPWCSGNLDLLSSLCQLYADRLVWGSSITLETCDGNGHSAKLVVPIGDHTPRTSTGRVPLRSWSNVPSGETFIVPDSDKVAGSVFINGSIPRFPISEGHWLKLDARNGKIQPPITCSGLPALQDAANCFLFDQEGREVAENCTMVSEFGIGLNSSIKVFTGLSIFDEKMAGTVHLGLGSSIQFGGPTDSPMHSDFVIRKPSVWIDSSQIINDGNLCLRESDVFPHWSAAPVGLFDPNLKVSRTGFTWQEERKRGRILARREWISDRTEGLTSTQIGDEETAAIATQVLWALENRGPQFAQDLRDSVPDAVPEGALERTIELLLRFRLVRQE